MPTRPRLPWDQRLALPVAEVAELLTMDRKQVHDLMEDWAFGDPARLPTHGRTRPTKRIPTELFKAYVAGDRQYPPGDPRGQRAEQRGRASA